jgi:hypothetical protein
MSGRRRLNGGTECSMFNAPCVFVAFHRLSIGVDGIGWDDS